jgi:Icc-related predicted phosphoesterase
MVNRLRFGRYLDVLITHAPPFGIHDDADLPHQGFSVFLKLMQRFRPRYLLHGHKHIYGLDTWRTRFGETEVINVYPYRLLELEL